MKYIPGFTTHQNFTYFYSYIGLWSSIEAYLSQVCCCMPAMTGYVRRSWPCIHKSRHSSTLPTSSEGATVVPGTQFAMFDPPSTAGASEDVEKYSTSRHSSTNKSQDSAPSPVIALQPGQRSPLTPPPKHPSRQYFVTTHHDVSDTRGAPDILFHDHANEVRLEVTDSPESLVRAQLRYIDRDQNYHDVELQGEYPRRPATPRPSSKCAMRSFPRTLSPDLVPFAREKPSWDQLREE